MRHGIYWLKVDKTLKKVCTVQLVEDCLCRPSLKMSKEGAVTRTSDRLFHRWCQMERRSRRMHLYSSTGADKADSDNGC